MRPSVWLSAFAFAGSSVASRFDANRHLRRQTGSANAPPLPYVPVYDFTMPIDHFTASDTRTYNNRYFVNDTYYKPGGPVIIYDNGEGGILNSTAAEMLAEYNGTVSAPMRLAAQLNGVAIAWEHRYYGFSLPVPMDNDTGLPVGGAAGYKYLTVDQALEDLAYFARNINKTTLNQNSVIESTANLDPYHTPWIMIGGSYPGARAAWARIRNPEIFYASWSSSAPVESRPDGSIYFNQISRALPTNCTSDLHSIAAWVDQTLTSGTQDEVQYLQAGVYLMQPLSTTETNLTYAYQMTPAGLAYNMLANLVNGDITFQNYGAQQTLQIFCDYLETFNATSYVDTVEALPSTADTRDVVLAGLNNPGGSPSAPNGIFAANSNNGQVGFAAFTWAFYNYQSQLSQFEQSLSYPPQGPYTQSVIDSNSWTWQTFTQMGYFQYANTSSQFQFLSSKFVTEDYVVQDEEGAYSSFETSDFPSSVNTTQPLSYGGWSMTPSNVMFTNGQYDPWRAFGVSSLEKQDGAPQRPLTTTVPQCNTPPSGSNVFGIVYPGAVHAEDISIDPSFHQGSEQTPKPLYQGLDLFVKAYNTWQPCFNQSRQAAQSTKGGSSGTKNAARRIGGDENVVIGLVFGVVLLTFSLF